MEPAVIPTEFIVDTTMVEPNTDDTTSVDWMTAVSVNKVEDPRLTVVTVDAVTIV